MIIPTEERIKIHQHFFSEGVMVAKKDARIVHKETGLRNLHVMKALQSLKSRGYAKEQYVWQHYHWSITDEGVTYLREQLVLPANVVPKTQQRQAEGPQRDARAQRKVTEARPVYFEFSEKNTNFFLFFSTIFEKKSHGDRAQYRRDGDKTGDAGAPEKQFTYRGGYGRGRPGNMDTQE